MKNFSARITKEMMENYEYEKILMMIKCSKKDGCGFYV